MSVAVPNSSQRRKWMSSAVPNSSHRGGTWRMHLQLYSCSTDAVHRVTGCG